MPTDTDVYHAGLPSHSNTSDVYIGLGPNNVSKQMRVYKDQDAYKDFDWSHEHKISDIQDFPKEMYMYNDTLVLMEVML